ncbi:MAG: hypothetical protein OXC31_01370 [Spirochaetaceae bacterium]|nr:hypothetical protein [Spirochaetaceae bacterium]
MPAATAAAFTGIHNENEFYSHHYLSEILSGDIRSTVDRWRESAEAGGGQTPYAALRALAGDYVRRPPAEGRQGRHRLDPAPPWRRHRNRHRPRLGGLRSPRRHRDSPHHRRHPPRRSRRALDRVPRTFDRCDREQDYRTAWEAFTQRFGILGGQHRSRARGRTEHGSDRLRP